MKTFQLSLSKFSRDSTPVSQPSDLSVSVGQYKRFVSLFIVLSVSVSTSVSLSFSFSLPLSLSMTLDFQTSPKGISRVISQLRKILYIHPFNGLRSLSRWSFLSTHVRYPYYVSTLIKHKDGHSFLFGTLIVLKVIS